MRNLSPVNLAISSIEAVCSCWSARTKKNGPSHTIGLIRLVGTYRHGSSGKPDAQAIVWRIREFGDIARFAVLVVDARPLEYEWGDDLDLSPAAADVPHLIVVDESQRKAFAPIVGSQYLRTDYNGALDEAEVLARQLREGSQPIREYKWIEVWLDTQSNRDVALAAGLADGSVDLLSVSHPERILSTYAGEDEARSYLQGLGYARMDGRRNT